MTNVIHFLNNLGLDSLHFFWTPVFIWTTIAAGYLFLNKKRSSDASSLTLPPQLDYQILTAIMLALPLGALLTLIAPFSIAAPEVLRVLEPTVPTEISQILSPDNSSALAAAAPLGAYTLIGLLTLIVIMISAFKLCQLIKETLQIRRTGLALQESVPAEIEDDVHKLIADWDLSEKVSIVFSTEEHAPMTFGWRKATIILPHSLKTQPQSLRMALFHELAHIRNADYARRWLEYAISAVFFFNPVVHAVIRHIDYLREANCDWEVLKQRNVSPSQYASLLLDFATQNRAIPRLELSMSAHKNSLKRRIQAMKNYSLFSNNIFSSRRLTFALSVCLLAIATLIVACEVKFEKDNSITIIDPGTNHPDATLPELVVAPEDESLNNQEIFMVVEQMPKLIGGLASIQQEIKYPQIAKKAGIEGRVFVQFVVDTVGNVVSPQIVKGIGAGCDEEALRAVKKAKFTPGMQRGQAVNVKMSIPITFKLNNVATAKLELTEKLLHLRKKMEEVQIQLNEVQDQHEYAAHNELSEEKLIEIKKNIEKLSKVKEEITAQLVEAELHLKTMASQ